MHNMDINGIILDLQHHQKLKRDAAIERLAAAADNITTQDLHVFETEFVRVLLSHSNDDCLWESAQGFLLATKMLLIKNKQVCGLFKLVHYYLHCCFVCCGVVCIVVVQNIIC